MTTTKWEKDPDSILDYSFNWQGWLPEGDNLERAEIFITPTGELNYQQVVIKDNMAFVWLTGGVDKSTYKVVCRVYTTDGRREDDTQMVLMKHS